MQQANEEVLDIIRLNLEAKLMEWKKEGFPEIPILLRGLWEKKEQSSPADENYSHLLTLWRLWVEEAEIISQEHNSNKVMQLSVEAENIPWEPILNDELPSSQQQPGADDQLNKDLMLVINSKLEAMKKHNVRQGNNLDPETIERLEREAFNLSS
jgi:hypothetical protein